MRFDHQELRRGTRVTRLCQVKFIDKAEMSIDTPQTSSPDPLLDRQHRDQNPPMRRDEPSGAHSHEDETIADLRRTVAQLEEALQSRIVIEQAKGVLAERLAVPVTDAFELLRSAARSHRLRIHDLARRVVDERVTPAPVIAAIARTQRLQSTWIREVSEAHRRRFDELAAVIATRTQQAADPRES
jgi:ANTAR domain-containing protein